MRRLPSENCRLGAFTRAARPCPRILNGFRRRTLYSTPPTGAFMARRENFRRASQDGRGPKQSSRSCIIFELNAPAVASRRRAVRLSVVVRGMVVMVVGLVPMVMVVVMVPVVVVVMMV